RAPATLGCASREARPPVLGGDRGRGECAPEGTHSQAKALAGSDPRSAGTRPPRGSFTPQLQARVTVESLPRSRQQALASRHDRAQFPHHPAIARRSAASAPAVRLELLRERQEALAPPPASIGTDAAHSGASAARPALPAEWSKEP